MSVDAAQAASTLTEAWERMCGALPYGWAEPGDGFLACVTTVPLATLNGVWAHSVTPSRERMAELLERVAAAGVPYCMQLRPGCDESIRELARERGLGRNEDVPLMVLPRAAALDCPAPAELAIHTLAPNDAFRHAQVAARGFGDDEAHFRMLVAPPLVELEGARCYIGEVAGEAVVSGFAFTLGESVGVFNIATPSRWRRRGYGAAMTARAIADAAAVGARWAWLQLSAEGYSIYERLGFRMSESWECWLAEPR